MKIFLVHPAQAAQGGTITLGEKFEMLDQRAHGRIVAVAFLQLDREAFGEIARAHAGRIEGLQNREHELDIAAPGTEFVGNAVEIAGEVTRLVHHIDQILADHAAGRIGNRQRHLLGKMIGQRRLDRNESFEIVIFAACRARRPTILNKPAPVAQAWQRFSPPSSGKTFSSSVPSPCSIELRLVSRSAPIQSALLVPSSLLSGGGCSLLSRGCRCLIVVRPLK